MSWLNQRRIERKAQRRNRRRNETALSKAFHINAKPQYGLTLYKFEFVKSSQEIVKLYSPLDTNASEVPNLSSGSEIISPSKSIT